MDLIPWVVLLVVAGTIELVTYERTGRTMSQKLWAFHRRHPWSRWVTLGLLILLTVHLVWRIP